LTAEGKHISVPAWVAVVDQHCSLLLKTFVQQQVCSCCRVLSLSLCCTPSAHLKVYSLHSQLGVLCCPLHNCLLPPLLYPPLADRLLLPGAGAG
jgi:hypothetical protein